MADPPAPTIRRLPEDVVNRIAAGEVVVSPAAALKELLENSIDAGACSITVTVRGGGAKLLQVTDDGKGVAPEDLPLLCERHATSKLRAFDDLTSVSTFGFRGEALASVSHVARVSVRTARAGDKHAMHARYVDGALAGAPVPCAGVPGTQLAVEDLFYNLPARRRALRGGAEEYRGVVDVVARYAIRYCGVAFLCRRADGRGGADVRTQGGGSVVGNIRAGFGGNVAQELLEVAVQLPEVGVVVEGRATKSGFSMRKGVFVVFVNGRLVNCSPLKRAVDAVYARHLPKGGHAFVYVDVRMRPRDVDVNVHPNKMEVRFLNETRIVDALVGRLEDALRADGTSRTFVAQALVPAQPRGGGFLPDRSQGLKRFGAALHPDGTQAEGTQGGGTQGGGTQGGGDPPPVSKRRKVRAASARALIDAEAEDGRAGGGEGSGDEEPDEEDVRFINDGEEDDASVSSLPVGGGGGADRPAEGKAREDPDFDVTDDELDFEDGPGASSGAGVEGGAKDGGGSAQKPPPLPRDKVRTSRSAPVGAMDAFITHGKARSVALDLRRRRQRRRGAPPMLTSVADAVEGLRARAHAALADMLRSHTFVGVASDRYALVQHQTKLILVDVAPVVTELMYRQTLMRFGDLDSMRLDPPASLLELATMAAEDGVDGGSPVGTPDDGRGGVVEEARRTVALILEKAPLLDEYFSIVVAGSTVDDAVLEQVPVLFEGVVPDLSRTPEFLVALLAVDWSQEQPCLLGVARALAEWYGRDWKPDARSYRDEAADASACAGDGKGNAADGPSQRDGPSQPDGPSQTLAERTEWLLRHVFFESLRFDFDPPNRLAKCFREITSTRKLYRIFERC